MTDLANSRVIVTGGSAGLGLAMVEGLAERGASVTGIARDHTKLGAARDAGARTIVGDATDAALINRTVADIDPDVLILNAGARLPMATIDQQDWRPAGLGRFLGGMEYRREGDAYWHSGGAQNADAAWRARPHHVERRRDGDEPPGNRAQQLAPVRRLYRRKEDAVVHGASGECCLAGP